MQDTTVSQPPQLPGLARLLHVAQRNLLWLLLTCYLLAALWPGPGAALRGWALGTLHVGAGKLEFTVPLLLLACLLFNAGLAAQVEEIRGLWRRPLLVCGGVAANFAAPVLFAYAATKALGLWPEPDEIQNLLVGLALIAAMPIAGASTAWAQNAGGNLALSLGLVLASTLLSPVLTPLVLRLLQPLGTGDYGEDIGELAHSGTQLFLMAAVVMPSLSGIGLRRALPEPLMARLHPALKLANIGALLVLNYSNAALSLPPILRSPDLDFLVLVGLTVSTMCGLAFGLGWCIARSLRGSHADAVSLMFGLGMNNNGTGLVLASSTLGDHPLVMVPILFYNLAQQIVAGLVDRLLHRKRGREIPR